MEVTELAPAKFNLGLDTIKKRPDGYHELAMVMASLDLKDRLTLRECKEDCIFITSNRPYLPADKKNNAYQVAAAIKEKYQIKTGLQIEIEKKIPVSAGLGGGSTDAAAVIRGLNQLWHLKMSFKEMVDIGLLAGTDVPYCLVGKPAYVTGLGEEVSLLPTLPNMWVILVKPPVSVSTPKIFQQLDVLHAFHPDIASLVAGIKRHSYDEILKNVGNSLEEVTMAAYPIVKTVKEKMLAFGCDATVMTGSGPTVVGFCHKFSQGKRICNSLRGFCREVYLLRVI